MNLPQEVVPDHPSCRSGSRWAAMKPEELMLLCDRHAQINRGQDRKYKGLNDRHENMKRDESQRNDGWKNSGGEAKSRVLRHQRLHWNQQHGQENSIEQFA